MTTNVNQLGKLETEWVLQSLRKELDAELMSLRQDVITPEKTISHEEINKAKKILFLTELCSELQLQLAILYMAPEKE